jgi:hypothetical protein
VVEAYAFSAAQIDYAQAVGIDGAGNIIPGCNVKDTSKGTGWAKSTNGDCNGAVYAQVTAWKN